MHSPPNGDPPQPPAGGPVPPVPALATLVHRLSGRTISMADSQTVAERAVTQARAAEKAAGAAPESATEQGVLDFGASLYAHQREVARFSAAWEAMSDDPEAVAAHFEGKGVSLTLVTEKLDAARHALEGLRDAIFDA